MRPCGLGTCLCMKTNSYYYNYYRYYEMFNMGANSAYHA